MSASTAKVVFSPSGRRGEFALGTPVLQAARELGVDIDSVCGGRGLCGRCQILCCEGNFTKHGIVSRAANLSPPGAAEGQYGVRNGPLQAGRRLSCQAAVQGDLLIDVPAESQVHRQVVRKDPGQREIRLDPDIHLYFVEVREAELDHAGSDLSHLLEALAEQWDLQGLSWRSAVLKRLQAILREGQWSVTVALYQQREILALWPGFKDGVYGVAVDVGSTTIAAHLTDLSSGEVLASSGMMNPQIRFGEDLMSRVSYVMMHPEGSAEMTRVVREAINSLLAEICATAQVATADILSAVLVGNPVMHHLLLGISPQELGGAPFALAVDSALYLGAPELELDINPGAVIYLPPCIAGHVGADATAMILSEQPHAYEDISLLIDIGTNAEIVLGNRHRLLACSSPTGPAFEGAQIRCGQRAAPGAIERVRIDADTLQARVKVIGSELWSDHPDFSAEVAGTGVTGICGSGIIEALAEMYLAGIISGDGVIDGSLADGSQLVVADGRTFSYILYANAGSTITISQTDVRQIQLAKAALYAGVKLLQDRLGSGSVDRIRLAGAFGNHIDPRFAMVLGMLPDCPLQQVESAGNAAGTGARIALLNRESRSEIEAVVQRIEKIETAVEAKFQEYFVDAMAIPHRTDAFPNLFAEVAPPRRIRPERGQMTDSPGKRPRRKRSR
ncbi:MAG: ASKHA domain-containing protein [Halieaceae bacterium]|nr:ASKHA domain-containing protein [Halieaceae bacterium]